MRIRVHKYAGASRVPIVAGQWTEWARAIRERHLHAAGRHEHMTMTLARRQIVFSGTRWENNAWTFAPQIRLAITALLPASIFQVVRERYTREQTLLPHASQLQREPAATRRVLAHRARRHDAPDALSRRTNRESRWNGGDDSAYVLQSNTRFVFHSMPIPAQAMQNTPLARILARLEQSESETRFDRQLSQPTAKILQRVLETRHRVEERFARAPIVLQNHSAANAARAAQGGQSFEYSEWTTPRPRAIGGQAWDVPNEMPFNLEQLTDQVARRIDNRITAYRERRGKGA
jgi:hypothetical protein